MDMNIVFSCDENYAPFLATTLASILWNSAEEDHFSFYVLDGGLSRLSKAKISALRQRKDFTISYIPFDYAKVEACPTMAHFSKAAYFRFFMAELIPTADRLLYLDVDLIIKTSLSPLYTTDMGKNIIAAIPRGKSDRLGMKDQRLFNSGVMLIDAESWRKWNIAEKLVSTTNKIIDKIKLVDQDVLNFLFKNQITYIENEWNVRQQDVNKVSGAKILHFSGAKFESALCIELFTYLDKTEFTSFGTNSHSELLYHLLYKEKTRQHKTEECSKKSVAFILTKFLDLTSLQSIIKYFTEHQDISVKICVLGETLESPQDKFLKMHLENHNIPHYTQLSELINDVVFLTNPYLDPLIYRYLLELNNKIIYIPYGTSISNEDYTHEVHYNRLVHNIAWKVYAIDDFQITLYKKYCTNFHHKRIKAIHTSPKFDPISHNWEKTAGKAKTFLWNIHFNAIPGDHIEGLDKTWSAFFFYHKAIHEFFKKNTQLSLVIRPHHNVYYYNKIEILNALQKFESLPNVRIEPALAFGYDSALSEADAFISDLSSMVVDMSITGKPILLLTYEKSCQWNSFAENIFSTFTYTVHSTPEFERVTQDLAEGIDPLRTQRIQALESESIFTLRRPAAEIIAEDIFPNITN